MFSNYGWNQLRRDVIAGLTVAAIAVPQSMAYALIAGVDPRYGLYSAIVVTALASILGSSSHLINGPTNAISLVVFSALAAFDPDARAEAFEATFLLGIMVGTIQIGIALFKLGDLTRYISESVVLGFMAGAGLLVGLSQIGNLLGIPDKGTGHQHLLHRLWLTVTSSDPVNLRALGIGLGTVVVVLVMRKFVRKYQLPRIDMLTAVVVGSILTASLGWSEPAASGKPLVPVVGRVPAGLPAFHVPDIKFEWVPNMAGSALAIAFLGLLEALAIAKAIANETRQPLDYNRQCLAEGLANLGGGLFQCLPGSGSLTRSAINYQSGAVSRFSGVVAAGAVALVVILFAPLARYIPKSALAGLLLITAAGLIDRKRLLYTLRASRFDAGLVLATAFTAVFISVEFAILVGTALSIVLYVPRAARLKATELTVTEERVVRGWLPTDPVAEDVVLFDLEGELFFGAIRELDRYLDDLKARALDGARVIVLRLKRTRNPDVVCMERLEHFLHEMHEHQIVVLLCGVRPDFARSMKNLRFQEWFPSEQVFPETDTRDSATLKAVRHAYELLGREAHEPKQSELYYLV
jgi:SulP family sulfate permease